MKLAVGIIITNNKNELLLLQRGPEARSQQGKWENVGGEVEEGESPEQACSREILEELGVNIYELKEVYIDEDPNGEWKVHVFEGKINETPEIKEPDKCSAIQWAAKETLKDIDLTTYSRRDFERLGWIK